MKQCLNFIFLSVISMLFKSTEELSIIFEDTSMNIEWSQIYPNTRWCGCGTYPKDGSLGKDEFTDGCCKADEIVNGLKNIYDYTVVSCECETAFQQCLLKNIQDNKNGDSSVGVGQLYFTLGMRYPKEDFPIIQCLSRTTFGNRCKDYELNTSLPKKWQWFDVLPFDILPSNSSLE